MPTIITPRALRDGLAAGSWILAGKLPDPPPEWRDHRRRRMAVAVRAAKLFLVHRYSYAEVERGLINNAMLPKPVEPQRIGQYIRKGTNFFLERGVFTPVKLKPVKSSKKKAGVIA